MPKRKIVLHNDIKVLKHKRHISRNLLWWILLPVGSAVVVILALFVSSMITLTGSNTDTLKYSAKSYYAPCFGVFDSYSDAQNTASLSVLQGGAGYIFEDKNYYVLGNIYSTYDECYTVVSRIESNAYTMSIYELKCKKIKVKTENKDILAKIVDYLTKTRENVYKVSNDIDEKLLTPMQATTKIIDYKSEGNNLILLAKDMYDTSGDKDILRGISYLNYACNLLDSVTYKLIGGDSVGSTLRYCNVSFAVWVKEFCENL